VDLRKMLKWFLLVVLFGRLTIYLVQKFPLPQFLNEWQNCSLCSGVWIFSILAAIFRVDLLSTVFYELGVGYVPFVSEFFTGAITSWMVYIFEIGFRERYLNVTILE
ncbi:hypothetical protein HN960_01645, partial [Candidatus Peregrinibacteria bacterium]|nr:hypothetical protein [Candidatus Peregrinibacteria bacterium]